MPQTLYWPCLLPRLRHISWFVCRVWQLVRLAPPWTYDEILITMPAQHTPVARPTSLLAGNDVKLERTNNCGPSGRKQRDHPYRIDLLRVSCPLGTIVPERAIGPGARMGVVHAHPRWLGWPASAREDKEVS
jgi:hypothetical protein